MGTALFLFAHQDDECAVFQIIYSSLKLNKSVHCFYFTSGTADGLNSNRRDIETKSVLVKLGVKENHIHFFGSMNFIPDCKLINYINCCYDFIKKILCNYSNNVEIYLPAFEGGHPDHDTLHIAGVSASQYYGFIKKTYQYPLYNGYKCFKPLFRVLLPLYENGEIYSSKIPYINRVRFLIFCLQYPSQLKTWVGLFPFFFLHYLFYGTQSIQAVSLDRLRQRPHKGDLYYERRKFATWEKIRFKYEFFLNQNKITKT